MSRTSGTTPPRAVDAPLRAAFTLIERQPVPEALTALVEALTAEAPDGEDPAG